jgi:hypothetical protein
LNLEWTTGLKTANWRDSYAKLLAERVWHDLSHWISFRWIKLDGEGVRLPAASSGGGAVAEKAEASPEFISFNVPGIIGHGICTGRMRR